MSDLISRQAAINAIENTECELLPEEWNELTDSIMNVPSAQPDFYDYSDIEPLWESFAKEHDVNLTDGAKQLKDAMWAGYRKGKADAQPEQQWIPIKTRPMTDEERDYWSEHYGYDIEYEDAVMFDCKMPEDKQPVWVQSKCGYIYEDVCENDDGMIGMEGNGDWNDIVAWMPKYVPEPWKGEEHVPDE